MPSNIAQADLIRTTYARAGLNIDDPKDRPQFFHAHGTGTPAGDPQESQAISTAFFANDKISDTIYAGSIKTIIGCIYFILSFNFRPLSALLKLKDGFYPSDVTLNSQYSAGVWFTDLECCTDTQRVRQVSLV